MADAQGRQRHSYADLPAELVRRIFAGAGDDKFTCTLTVEDRLRVEATCRAWRQALQGLPFRSLSLDSSDSRPHRQAATAAKQRWAVLARPAATCVAVWGAPEESTQALHSLDREALQKLRLCTTPPSSALPHPHVFPNLRALSVHLWTWDAAWFGRLGQLPRLERLDVDTSAPAGQAPQACVVPGLSALTYLDFHVEPDNSHAAAAIVLCVDPATLPSLRDLEVCSAQAPIELRTAASPTATTVPLRSLRRLQLCCVQSAAVDFAALPALTRLDLAELGELHGAASIAGATSLRCLELSGVTEEDGEEDDLSLAQPWVLELLQHAPPSLRSLQLRGEWPPAVAEALVGLAQLRALSLEDSHMDAPAAQQLGDGPAWESLRALRWACQGPLPEAARRASRLELLHYHCLDSSTVCDLRLDLSSSLPSLRCVRISGPWTRSGEPEGRVRAEVACQLLPRLYHLDLRFGWSQDEFEGASAWLALRG